ncbi:aminotransferase class I/II-fold pyridoxal phosphate-dependent enzyme [Algoriphagus halophilus]|uniref:aminotransferase class I/II-fold pyridoxal phosphate-dependent enzyme n=1 Tax=Algoriphagus halophilus TaxID=226505 RepID=UPI00358F87F1
MSRVFEKRYGFQKCLLTTSCTDALEMAALLCDIQPGDEVIVPSFTFVSTANAFVLRGAKVVFVDSKSDHPNMDEKLIEELITPKTKAIVIVHYGGVPCEMDTILEIANRYHLLVIEDAAQGIDSFYQGKALGSMGHLGCMSFHETKNIQSGEGGMLMINDPSLIKRAEILWEKGTERVAFSRGEIQKYGWVDQGSSFCLLNLLRHSFGLS